MLKILAQLLRADMLSLCLLDKHGLKCPYTTLFSKKSVERLRSLRLGFIDDAVLESFLELLEALDMQISLVEAMSVMRVGNVTRGLLLLLAMRCFA